MRSISLPSIRIRAALGLLAVLMLVLGSFRAAAQEAKPAPPPASAEAKDKDKAAEKAAPLPADAHVAQSMQLEGKPLHYTVTVGTLPVNDTTRRLARWSLPRTPSKARTGRSPSR